jgi:hypothetical protein
VRGGNDNEELLLRYGWPIGWRRTQTAFGSTTDIRVTEYHPTPSYNFAPVEALYDTSATAQNDGWELEARVPESRYSPRMIGNVAPLGMQVARFRRGDSVLVVSAHAAAHDSLGDAADAVLAVALPDGTTRRASAAGRVGRARLMVESFPMLAGVEVTDTTTRTLARARSLLRVPDHTAGLALSDMLLFRVAEGAPESLDAALDAAVPGDTLSRSRPIGIYWRPTASPNRVRASTSASPSSASIAAGSAARSSCCDWPSPTTRFDCAGTTRGPRHRARQSHAPSRSIWPINRRASTASPLD